MSSKSLQKFGCFIVVGIFILSGCHRTHRTYIVHRNGPPPHAPAHGYHKKYAYYYYPSSYVYYDAGRGVYFYRINATWRTGSALPSSVHIDAGEGVLVHLDTDKPYTLFSTHKSKYPPGHAKVKPGRAKVNVGRVKGKGNPHKF